MTNAELTRFYGLRDTLFQGIKHYFDTSDGHCKSYEGAFAIHFPNYFEQERERWGISLDCYVLGDGRHYGWSGSTFSEALDAAEKDILKWVCNELECDRTED